jgi:uncharacterized membrane protein/protein-disulfide isomerase
MIFKSRYSNSEIVTLELLKTIGVKVTSEAVVEELSRHPDFPNLLAISDVLNNYGVNANAYRVTKQDLTEIPCPFIISTQKRGEEFLVVTKVSEKNAMVLGNNQKIQAMSLPQLQDVFGEVVLVPEDIKILEANHHSGSFHFDQIRNSVVISFAIILLFAGATLIGSHPLNWQFMIVLFLKTAGLVVSVLLLIQSIDNNNPFVQTLCGIGRTNCNAILSSKAANAFNGLSWSDIGFFYFAGTWLTTLMIGKEIPTLQFLAALNFASLPYTFYSIYYQAKIAKQWCLFCCSIQFLLWVEFGSIVTVFETPFKFPTTDRMMMILICMIIPAMVWLLIKPVLLKSQQVGLIKAQVRNLKYNTNVFQNLLRENPKYTIPQTDWSITLGNVEAENIITMVSNPYCPPCGKTHRVLNEWLSRDLSVQLRLVFTAGDSDIETPVTRHLMALAEQDDREVIKNALHDWYEQKQKNYAQWAKEYPVVFDETQYYKLQKQKDWCRLADIKATPTILINGYQLPEAYSIQDIKYLLLQR